MAIKDLVKLAIAIAVPLLVGFVGSYFTAPAIESWYADLVKPTLNPPSWVFGPAWAVLYVLMGVAAFLVWQRGFHRKDVRTALYIFVFQLFLNGIWSFIFFGLQSPLWALIDITLLWFAIVFTTTVFYRISPISAYLLIPYIAWVSFAAYLNAMIFLLN
ncbi:MAG: TspO/MBR family protein [Candidatus Paceibacterota bacterium]